MENRIQRGEVYFIFLDPGFGREIGGYKVRPVVVVSINDIHQKTRIVMVVPGTTTEVSKPNVVRVDNRRVLKEITFFQCHQLRAVDQGRMTSPPLGRLSDSEMQKIESAISSSLGLDLLL
jgi:mRNA-degrading endonuclease toxin of MazEF toxin-antitoxin module